MTDIGAISVDENREFFTLAFEHGYEVYSMSPIELKFKKDFMNFRINSISTTNEGNITVISMLPMAEENGRYSVLVWNNFFGEMENELSFKEPVYRVSIKRDILIIVLANSVCLYDFKKGEMQFQQLTAMNQYGVGEITFVNDIFKIAICGLVPGSVHIFSQDENTRQVFIQAHQHPITILKFSPDAALLATSSERGTLIRIFDTTNEMPLSTFRRGMLGSKIIAMAFSPSNKWLVVLSEKGTIHLFNAFERNTNEENPSKSISKIKIGKMNIANIFFTDDKTFSVITSIGLIFNVEISCNIMTITSRILIYAI